MPIFYYKCEDCGHDYEFIGKYSETPTCERCHSSQQKKQLTSFAVGSIKGAEASSGPVSPRAAEPGHVHSGGCCTPSKGCSADARADSLVKKYLD